MTRRGAASTRDTSRAQSRSAPRAAPPAPATRNRRSAAAAPTEPVSAAQRPQRPRVRRSNALAETPATHPSPQSEPPTAAKASRDASPGSRPRAAHDTSRGRGWPSRLHHELDRTAHRLRERFATRGPRRRTSADPKWVWHHAGAEGLERSIREIVAAAANGQRTVALSGRAIRTLKAAQDLLATTGSAPTPPAGRSCERCGDPIDPAKRAESRYCGKRCRQAASRERLKHEPPSAPSPPPETCAWCGDPMPPGLRPEARYCGKRCRQASSRFALGLRSVPAPSPRDTSPASASPAEPTRRRRARRQVLGDTSRAMRFAYADPPYPGKADNYPERREVDHRALIAWLTAEFPDGWALSTSASALQPVLALCPPGVRVCSWHRAVRPTASRRAISAWEPLIVCGGRELPTHEPQNVRDALVYGGRYRAYPGAIVGMKPPQFAGWLFAQLGARAGDELFDLYPGSGAVSEAWRRYSGRRARSGRSEKCSRCFGAAEPCLRCIADAGNPAPGDFVLGPDLEEIRRCGCGRVYGAYHAGSSLCFLMEAPGRRQVYNCVRCRKRLSRRTTTNCTAEAARTQGPSDTSLPAADHPSPPLPYDLAAVNREQALTCPVNGAVCESIACLDVGCTAQDASLDTGKAA